MTNFISGGSITAGFLKARRSNPGNPYVVRMGREGCPGVMRLYDFSPDDVLRYRKLKSNAFHEQGGVNIIEMWTTRTMYKHNGTTISTTRRSPRQRARSEASTRLRSYRLGSCFATSPIYSRTTLRTTRSRVISETCWMVSPRMIPFAMCTISCATIPLKAPSLPPWCGTLGTSSKVPWICWTLTAQSL
jgi:hypothetical protein